MSNAPRQLTEVADRTTAALEAIFAAETATWRDLDPMIERPLTDLAEFVGGGGKRIRPMFLKSLHLDQLLSLKLFQTPSERPLVIPRIIWHVNN